VISPMLTALPRIAVSVVVAVLVAGTSAAALAHYHHHHHGNGGGDDVNDSSGSDTKSIGPVHGLGSSHNPIVYHPVHVPGSSHNPIVVLKSPYPPGTIIHDHRNGKDCVILIGGDGIHGYNTCNGHQRN
jgi:hypothetical protein